ncbi:CPK24 [Symbiodinium natans]|uniref:CPK24 protein n=1 Tax=Symbiodinium natans TaxID=878477 RepID=A0A812SA24_9DINO|nr:CPK24 [Symbiodinium natans]
MDDKVGPVTLDGKHEVAALIRSRFLQHLKDAGGGSVLRGWRSSLDPDFHQRAARQDVCKMVLAANLEGGEAAAHVLLTQFGTCESLSLVEIAPEAGVLVCRFRRFLAQFGNIRKFLEDMQAAGNMELSFDGFAALCRRHGFDPGAHDLRDLFSLCSKGKDHLSPEDFLFLETDENVRQQEITRQSQLKFTKQDVHHAFLAEAYKEDRGRSVSNRHRLAPRPWHDRAFETLPQVISRRNQSWFHEKKSKNAEARQQFLKYIRRNYGSEVRAWRRALDPDATFQLTLTTFKRWFRNETNLRESIDLQTLWRSLDRDGSGCLGMEELAPQSAATLGCFRKWLRGRLGSCASAWEHEAVSDAFSNLHAEGSWVSRTKLLINAFAKAIKQIGWRPILDQQTRLALLASLDYFGCGFLSRSDLEWLDAWEPPEWLYSEPDGEAWVQLRRLIMGRYEHPLAAWRGLLDRDDSNSVSWSEFKEACRRVGFQGNIGGAWRTLDDDLSGTITLREFDAASAKILTSFKAWCDLHYGSFEHLFKSMDKDRSGGVSFSELRRACRNGGWKGNVHVLFKCLDVDNYGDGQRTIELEELQFLDSWDPLEDEPLEEHLNQADETARMPARRSQLSQSSPVLPKLV